MATPAQATFNQAGLSGAFDKNKFNAQFYATHQGDFEALRPRAQATPTMTVQVQAATVQSFYRQIYFNNAQSAYAGGNSTTFTAPVSNPRIDVLYLSDTGVLTILQGTEAVGPVPPAYPDLSKHFPICEVFLRVGMTMIVNVEDSGANPTQGYIYRDVRPWATMSGVTDGSITTAKLANGAVTAAKTDFFKTGDWIISSVTTARPGWTNVSATYSNKFMRVNATPLTTGGADTHTHPAGSYSAGATHTHGAGSYSWSTNANLAGGCCGGGRAAASPETVPIGGTSAGPSGGEAVTGTSGSTTDNTVPAFVQVVVFQKD